MSIESLAVAVIMTFAVFLILLGVTGLFKPEVAKRFLSSLATSSKKHYLEITIRIFVGVALLIIADSSPAPQIISVIGWVLIVTSTILAFIPWRWHHQFALLTVPAALRFMPLIAFSALAMGGILLFWLLTAGAFSIEGIL